MLKHFLLGVIGILCLTACRPKDEIYTPKPVGYFRLETPSHEYQILDTILPFTFEYSKHAKILNSKNQVQKFWFDLEYPQLGATVFFTYFPFNNLDTLSRLAYESNKFAEKHIIKADDIPISIINAPEDKVYGLIYEIEGSDVACPYQFWMTDSAHHFLRASLYFNCIPNNDSLAPVINYVKEDLLHLINTFKWK